jgi:hypothetical protein
MPFIARVLRAPTRTLGPGCFRVSPSSTFSRPSLSSGKPSSPRSTLTVMRTNEDFDAEVIENHSPGYFTLSATSALDADPFRTSSNPLAQPPSFQRATGHDAPFEARQSLERIARFLFRKAHAPELRRRDGERDLPAGTAAGRQTSTVAILDYSLSQSQSSLGAHECHRITSTNDKSARAPVSAAGNVTLIVTSHRDSHETV